MMQPLAERMRPKKLIDFVGQEKIVGKGSALRLAIENNNIPSFILWGPPGVGKTTLASMIAEECDRPFFALSAINSGVKDVRDTIAKAQNSNFFSRPNPILFIDEIHRFSKSQQDSLLGAVEKGIVTLIGATTENPSFEVIPALLSRCQVYTLDPLEKKELIAMVKNALVKDYYLKDLDITIKEYDSLLRYSGGDGRRLLNSLELIVNSLKGKSEAPIIIDNEQVSNNIQSNIARYDKTGEQHYDIISAFIKSIRGSDPNAALYYLARMIVGGEDPKFICRRMIISASEDIGLANPNALLIANQAFQAIQNIGMPEGRIIMSQAAVYLACSPKSNASYVAINKAMQKVSETGDLPVPISLRNAPTQLMKDLEYGQNYKYSHDYEGSFAYQEFMPPEISNETFYIPGDNPAENKLTEKVKKLWKEKYGY